MNQRKYLNVGCTVIIERKGRPWKTTRIENASGETVRVSGGFEYSALSGERLTNRHSSCDERLVPVTPERLAYLEVRDFLQQSSAISVSTMKLDAGRLQRLASLVREFRAVLAQ